MVRVSLVQFGSASAQSESRGDGLERFTGFLYNEECVVGMRRFIGFRTVPYNPRMPFVTVPDVQHIFEGLVLLKSQRPETLDNIS